MCNHIQTCIACKDKVMQLKMRIHKADKNEDLERLFDNAQVEIERLESKVSDLETQLLLAKQTPYNSMQGLSTYPILTRR